VLKRGKERLTWERLLYGRTLMLQLLPGQQ
jgi:hypothetical protein